MDNLFQIPIASLHTGFKAKTNGKAIKIEWIKLCKKKVMAGNPCSAFLQHVM